jgi:hypothetical protein
MLIGWYGALQAGLLEAYFSPDSSFGLVNLRLPSINGGEQKNPGWAQRPARKSGRAGEDRKCL